MNVRVLSPVQRAAADVVRALLHEAQAEPWHAWAGAPEEALAGAAHGADVVVMVGVDRPGAQRLIDQLPAGVPVLLLGDAQLESIFPNGAGVRAHGRLPADADDARVRAAVAALALGLAVYDPGSGPLRGTPLAAAALPDLQEPLTPRELEVFELMAEGLGNRDIARALGVSSHTAKFHVAQILQKTGATTRTEAVRHGLRLGLVGL